MNKNFRSFLSKVLPNFRNVPYTSHLIGISLHVRRLLLTLRERNEVPRT